MPAIADPIVQNIAEKQYIQNLHNTYIGKKQKMFFANDQEKKEYDHIQWVRKEIEVGEKELQEGKGLLLENKTDVDNFFEDIILRGRERNKNNTSNEN